MELEHTRSWPAALRIAMDHLAESPRYYVALARMEAQLEGNPRGLPTWGIPAVLLGAAGVGALLAWTTQPSAAAPAPAACDDVGPHGGSLEDVEYVEARTQGAPAAAALPMVIVLADGDPASSAAALSGLPVAVRVVAPRPLQDLAWIPDGTDPSAALADAAENLASFVERIQQCRPTTGRPVVAGYAAGADLAVALAGEIPLALGGAVLSAASFPAGLHPVGVPTMAIHGRDDAIVPYAAAQAAVEARVGAGEPITWIPMTGVGHSMAGALGIRWLEAIAAAAADQR